MSAFPYMTSSPPPTAGPLPIIERANLTSPYSGGGGGGGGGSSSITISTLNILQNDENDTGINLLYADGTSTILLQANTDINGNTSAVILNQQGEDLAGGATLIVGNIGLIGLEESFLTGVPGFINADNAGNLFISSLTISSLNSAAYPPPASLPNDIVVSTIGVGEPSGLSISGFPQPLITYGAQTLNAGGSTTINMDRSYTIPYYPFLTYRGILPANTSTLAVSTIDESSFLIFGEAGQSVQYMVVGN